MIIEIISVLSVSLLIYQLFLKRPTNFPPGPRPLPLLGNLLSIGSTPHLAFEKLSKTYGAIVGATFPDNKVICIHGYKLIKEAFNDPKLQGRNQNEASNYIFGDENGIIQAVGDTWSEQRRFALRHLRDFGFGKSSMEELIMDEVKEVLDWLKKQKGKSIPLQERFSLAVVNSLWKITTGERFDHDDAQLHQILEDLQKSAKLVFDCDYGKNIFIFTYPQLGKLFPNWSGWARLVASKIPRTALFSRIIEEHSTTLQEENPRDFVDVYLKEVRRTNSRESSFYSSRGVESLKSVMADFFVAGTDTTSVTLSWFSLYLLHYPRVQKKLQEELDRVVGSSRAASLTDRKSLPYTEAVILETLRLSSITPISVPHAATENTKFHGYDIPKGTIVFANLYANHHDPKVWGEDVGQFRPERFLTADGSTVVRHEALIPFSIGRRVCLGETLARDTLFLFAANLAQSFEVVVCQGQEKPPLECQIGQLTLSPANSSVVMKERTLG